MFSSIVGILRGSVEIARMERHVERLKTERARCLQCIKKIAGRSDKVFCSDRCRSLYNYYKNRSRSLTKVRVLGMLDKNYAILDMLIGDGVDEMGLTELEVMGFIPGYATAVTVRGKLWDMWCFDIRYNISSGRLFNLRRPHDVLKMLP